MKVVVDYNVCASTGACTQIAPEIFEIRKDGYLYVLHENPEGANQDLARQASDMCPTGAITIED